jgi:hypothetical protein
LELPSSVLNFRVPSRLILPDELSRARSRFGPRLLLLSPGEAEKRRTAHVGRILWCSKEMNVNFDALHERARERGWALSKSTEAARYGTMPIRYILKDNYGLMHFRNLDEVERRLNAKAKQS